MTTDRALTDPATPVNNTEEKVRVTREQLWPSRHWRCDGWPLAIRQIEKEDAGGGRHDKGRVCAGIVGDSGRAGKDAIALSNRVGAQRNVAVVEGREVQITRFGQAVTGLEAGVGRRLLWKTMTCCSARCFSATSGGARAERVADRGEHGLVISRSHPERVPCRLLPFLVPSGTKNTDKIARHFQVRTEYLRRTGMTARPPGRSV